MKKLTAAVAASLVLVGALAGCSSDSGGTDDSGPVSLTFWHGYTEADGGVLDSIVDDFNASQSDITITTETKTWAVIDDTLLPALSADSGPQIVAMPAERLPVYASKGALVGLDDFYDADDSNTAELNPEAVAMETVKGEKFGVPTGFVPLSVFYDKTKLAAAGVTSFPTTWDEWVDAAKKTTVDENGDGTPEQYGLALPDHSTVGNGVWPSLFESGGGSVTSEDGTSADLDSPENVATLDYWASAVQNDRISPTGLDGIAADKLFTSGKAVMHIGGPWMASLAADAGIDYGIAAIPAGPAEQAASAIGVSMAVTAQSSEAEQAAAEKFFAYFNTKDVATAWSLGSGWPALRTDVSASDVAENPVVASLTEIAPTSRALLPGVVNSTDVLSAMDEATQKALAGGDPEELLAAAQTAAESALAE
ncbi:MULTISPECIES: ABC transporter substrate-binding protein [unclassified Rathayibacter]|uniref:ABC transporter substrate-binding protein n=1 Tax=unclassified Rathayibacter TaxID=2609250 RepID=UPI0006F41663|nr:MULTISPECIES: ABC transporter substrate-binding protein [unclassified Rathayibacter]KQQ05684.1 sugar ABC transporter substrate-binding protein [Rathayibacter sp. Leaf294]KQS13542.1 sugar ABC transporter substrate-binding protein [Rathayibacter sp. Leaf185]